MLDLTQRGNLFEIQVAPGRKLDGNYTMMTELVCPVGALTTKYWRHKGRVWLLKGTPSVCPGCATGCNMWLDADPREQTAFRNRPRDNEDVNKYWMCDDGMLTYMRVHKDRVLRAKSGRGSDGKEIEVKEAITKAADALSKAKKLAVVLSAQHSSEDNLVLAELARAANATMFLSGKAKWEADKILRHQDQNPNRAGALKVSGSETLPGLSDLATDIGSYDAVIALGADADVDADTVASLKKPGAFVLLGTNTGPLSAVATLTLPIASWAECEGTFVNAKGMAQEFRRALSPKGDSLPAWEAIARIGRAMKLDLAYKRFTEVRAALNAKGLEPKLGVLDTSTDPKTHMPRAGV
jgi:NADH-quinone oxidoreductase subunit G